MQHIDASKGTALNSVLAKKKTNGRGSARNIFKNSMNRFGSGVGGHQALLNFENPRQRGVESS